jgi:soluble lytic murein transglycosylase-like protein
MEKKMKGTKSVLAVAYLCTALALTAGVSEADIYKRVHKDGRVEFSNRPSGRGWVFYMKESGYMPVIKFSRGGKPRKISSIIHEISREYQIDSALVKAIVAVESNNNPRAVSSKGAQGLMQLMPSTAKRLNVSRPFDPRENIIAGVKYIKGLIASYGDLRLALAAYNAGPGAVDRYAGIPPYRETINYVKKVLRYYKKFRNNKRLRVAGS